MILKKNLTINLDHNHHQNQKLELSVKPEKRKSKKPKHDLKNQTFGRWKALKYEFRWTGKKNPVKRTYWFCKCECGNEKWISGNRLLNGKSQSCGCLQKELASKRNRKSFGHAARHRLYIKYCRDAKRRGRDFSLLEEDFNNLTSDNCFYCGQEPSRKYNDSNLKYYGYYICNGIDRVDNEQGYIKENCVTCCEKCNNAKRCMKQEEFYKWIEKIYNHLKGVKKI